MQKYVQRMITERDELKGKIRKAFEAVEGNPFGMNDEQKLMLSEQLGHMSKYLTCLEKRIDYETNGGGK